MAGEEQTAEIVLAAPNHPGITPVSITAGHVYVLQFPIETVTFEAAGAHLRVLFESGGILELRDFFTAAQADDLFLRLEDGTLCLARDIMDVFLMDLQDLVCGAGLFAGILTDGGESLDDAVFPRADAASGVLPVGQEIGPAEGSEQGKIGPAAACAPETQLPDVFSSAPCADEEAALSEQYILSLFS